MGGLHVAMKVLLRLGYSSFCIGLAYVGLSPDPWAFFPYHPVLMTVAYLALTTEGLLSARHMLSGSKASNVLVHVSAQVLGIVSSLAGFAVIYIDKERRTKPHFLSWHALAGLSTVTLSIVQLFFGLYLYNFSSFCSLKGREKIARLVAVRLTHRIIGISTFIMGLLSLALGFHT